MATTADNWLIEYDACERFYRDILESIHTRDKQQKSGEGYSKLNAAIRQNLKKFSEDLQILHQNLIRTSASSYITQMEAERRQTKLANLESKQKCLLDAFNRKDSSFNVERNSLLGQTFSIQPTSPWNVEETDETRDKSIDDIRLQQRQALEVFQRRRVKELGLPIRKKLNKILEENIIEIGREAQDKGLEALSEIIVRQKHVANAINTEVEIQNEIIDDITDNVDSTRGRLIRETRHVKIVHKKSGTCSLWVIIILLLLAIVVVIAIPKPS